MAKCQIARENPRRRGTMRTKRGGPTLPRLGPNIFTAWPLFNKGHSTALTDFSNYERMLPGDPTTVFLKGFSYEACRTNATRPIITRYLRMTNQGEMAQHAQSA